MLRTMARNVRVCPALCVGFALYWTWVVITLQGPARLPWREIVPFPIPSWCLALLASGVAYAVIARMQVRVDVLSPRKKWWMGTTLTMFVGLLLSTIWIWCSPGGSMGLVLYCAGSIVMGAGSAGVLGEFARFYERLGVLVALSHGIVAMAVATCWQTIVTLLGAPILNMLIDPWFPIIIFGCFSHAAPSAMRRSFPHRDEASPTPSQATPVKLLFVAAVHGIAFGIGLGLLLQWGDLFIGPRLVGSLCAGLAALLLAVDAFYFKSDFTHMIFLVGLPLGAVGFLLMALAQSKGTLALGNAVQAVGACYLNIVFFGVSVYLARYHRVSALKVLPEVMACLSLGQVMGGCIGSALEFTVASSDAITTVASVMSVTLLLVSLYVSNGWRTGRDWEAVRPGALADGGQAGVESLAAMAGLTGREREVLEAVLAGKRRKAVAENLGVSEETVKTHMRNIYTKLNVHSQQELVEKVREAAS